MIDPIALSVKINDLILEQFPEMMNSKEYTSLGLQSTTHTQLHIARIVAVIEEDPALVAMLLNDVISAIQDSIPYITDLVAKELESKTSNSSPTQH